MHTFTVESQYEDGSPLSIKSEKNYRVYLFPDGVFIFYKTGIQYEFVLKGIYSVSNIKLFWVDSPIREKSLEEGKFTFIVDADTNCDDIFNSVLEGNKINFTELFAELDNFFDEHNLQYSWKTDTFSSLL